MLESAAFGTAGDRCSRELEEALAIAISVRFGIVNRNLSIVNRND